MSHWGFKIRDDLGLTFTTHDISFILIDVIHVWRERLKNSTLYHFQPCFRALLGIFSKKWPFLASISPSILIIWPYFKKWVVTPVKYYLNAQNRVIKRKSGPLGIRKSPKFPFVGERMATLRSSLRPKNLAKSHDFSLSGAI